ncbi:hemerythrin domain-containing protein [Thiomonas sp.]
MQSVTQLLSEHHKHCDHLLVAVESAALDENWDEAARLHADLSRDLESHIRAEESILFPAFEAFTGTADGPTQVMRLEHAQILQLLSAMVDAIDRRSSEDFGGQAETFVILMQQHNLKEENILYPMCDTSLSARSSEIVERLRHVIQAAS